MQEEIEQKVLAFIVSGAKVGGKLGTAPLKAAIRAYMNHRREVKADRRYEKRVKKQQAAIPRGKQTVKQLVGQNQGVSNIEIKDPSIKDFQRIARKYGVDYAVKKDRSCTPSKYLIFFKARDADAMTAAFAEYTGKKVKKAEKTAEKKAAREERPSVLQKLERYKEQAKTMIREQPVRKVPVR